MHDHTIEYDLFCKGCRNIQPTTLDFIVDTDESPDEIDEMDKNELLEYIGGVPDSSCINCGRSDEWEVLRIERSGNRKILNQFILSVLNEQERIKVSIEKGSESYSTSELELSISTAEKEAKRWINAMVAAGKKSTMVNDASTKASYIFLVVDLYADANQAKVSILNVVNMPVQGVINALNFLRQQFL